MTAGRGGLAAALLVAALAGCGGKTTGSGGGGGAGGGGASVTGPVPDPFVVARLGGELGALAADDRFVYWADETGLWRRAHGPDAPIERLLATERWITRLAPAGDSVFAFDDGLALRGVTPGEAAASVAQLDSVPWGLATDGARAVVGVDDRLEVHAVGAAVRAIALDGVGLALAARGGVAYAVVMGDEPRLVAVDLASGKRRELSRAPELSSAVDAAVWGERVLVSTAEGVVAFDRGGAAHTISPLGDSRIVADAAGWVLIPPAQVPVSHGADGVTRALSPGIDVAVQNANLAAGGVWAYATAYADDGLVLAAMPRFGGGEVWHLEAGAQATACAPSGARLVCSITTLDYEHLLVELDRGTIVHRFTTLDAPCERVAVEGDDVACLTADGTVVTSARQRGGALPVADVELGARLALHKGKLYLAEGDQVSIADPARGGGKRVIAAGPITRRAPENAGLGTDLVFADDRMYFVSAGGPADGIYRVDESGDVEPFWSYSGQRDLHPDLIRLGDALYVHDLAAVYRVPLDGTASSEVHAEAERRIIGLHAAGARLVAEIEGGPSGLALVAVGAGAAPQILWNSFYEGASGGDALIIRVGALQALVRIGP